MVREEMIIKVCGMRDSDNIREVCNLGIDWIGLIFWQRSPRNVTMIPTHAGIMPDRADGSYRQRHDKVKRVGVFVDDMPQNIITRIVSFQLDIVQLHGHESPTMISNLRRTVASDIRPGLKIIKALSISTRDDVEQYRQYSNTADYFLFDTKTPLAGGSGLQFDWSVLDAYDGNVPFLLSGGIGPDDAQRIRQFHHPQCIGIDLNSRFETAPARKDADSLQRFLDKLR